MADNTQLNPGTGGDVIKTEDLGAYKLAVSKLYLGARGVDGGPVTTANPLPVTIGNFPSTQPVSGTVSVANFPATQPVSVANFPASQAVSGTVSVANLPATQPVSGTVSVSNLPATQPVSGTVNVSNLPATQPVSGTVSVGNFPASQPVSVGNFPTTQPVSGTVSVANLPATQVVSGTVSVSNLPATQAISASTLPLPAGAATSAKQPALGVAGTAAADVLTVQGIASMTALKVDGSAATQPVSGTVSVSNLPATQPVSGTVSVSNFPATQPVSVGNFPATQPVSGTVSVGNFPATQPVSGTVAISGSVTSNANLMVASSAVSSGNPVPVSNIGSLPSGTNTIGSVIAQLATGILINGTTALTPKFASIAAVASGDNTLVAAVSGKKLRILKYTIVASGAVSTKFRSSSGTDLTGAMSLAANSGIGGAFCPIGLFESIPGDALVLNLSAAIPVAGHLTYVEV